MKKAGSIIREMVIITNLVLSQIHEFFLLDRRSSPSSSSSSEDERKYESKKSIPPPAPKISMSLNKPSIQPSKGIQIKLGTQAKPPPAVVQKTSKITSVFNIDESDEDEEMPPEAKMRMKNIGKDTPTSSGPNSYGKTKQGKLVSLFQMTFLS